MEKVDLVKSLDEAGLVMEEAARVVLAEPRFQRMPVTRALVEGKLIGEGELADFLARLFHLEYVVLDDVRPELLQLLPRSLMQDAAVVPYRMDGEELTIAVADPLDVATEDIVRGLTHLRLRRVVARRSDILRALQGPKGGMSQAIEGFVAHSPQQEVEFFAGRDDAEPAVPTDEFHEHDAPIIDLVAALISDAIQLKASDIHVEPQEGCLRVRYRIDGVLRVFGELPKKVQNAVISRIKLASGMDISEHRRPQDGRSQARVGRRWVDLRVSATPSYYGEKVVLRILDKSVGLLRLDGLGMSDEVYQVYARVLESPQGMVLLTGPTGSGKTTTLYASLNVRNRTADNLVTVEDPIEYQLAGITQIQMNPKAGVTFASALRSILRQDPDIIMVGEIRDLETAEIAFQAAETGHLVLSTLHTNSSPATIIRLSHMGVEPFLVASSLLAVVAQRLVRRICPACKREMRPDEGTLKFVELASQRELPATFWEGAGCDQCGKTGYRGRVGLYEILPMTDSLREQIYAGTSQDKISQTAFKEGFSTLLHDGLAKVAAGETSLAEVLRVVPIESAGAIARLLASESKV